MIQKKVVFFQEISAGDKFIYPSKAGDGFVKILTLRSIHGQHKFNAICLSTGAPLNIGDSEKVRAIKK